jgi:hypothetical protein
VQNEQSQPKVAIVLTGLLVAARVVYELHKLYPSTNIYFVLQQKSRQQFKKFDIRTSYAEIPA